jgi:hypothetical protein
MKEVLQISAWVATILGGINIAIQFLRFAFKKGIRVSHHVLYLSILIFVSGVYILASAEASKKTNVICKHVVSPYLRIVVNDIRGLRYYYGITDSLILKTSGKRQYPSEILNECEKLRYLEEKDIELTPESYYELGLLAHSERNYTGSIIYGEMAFTMDPNYPEPYLLVSASYRCMDSLDWANYYFSRYDRKTKLQQGQINVTVH